LSLVLSAIALAKAEASAEEEVLAKADKGSDILYDPTNGTVSFGNLLHTQKSPVGLIQE